MSASAPARPIPLPPPVTQAIRFLPLITTFSDFVWSPALPRQADSSAVYGAKLRTRATISRELPNLLRRRGHQDRSADNSNSTHYQKLSWLGHSPMS